VVDSEYFALVLVLLCGW